MNVRERLARGIARGDFAASGSFSGEDAPRVSYVSETRREDGKVRVEIHLHATLTDEQWEWVTR